MTKMFSRYFRVVVVLCFTVGGINSLEAENPFEDAVKQLTSDNVIGYVQPLVNSFGANMNSGFPGSARIGKLGIHVRFQLIGMAALIGDAQKTYQATPPPPFPQEPVETATVFGGKGTVVTHPGGVQYRFQNGQIDTRFVPFVVPQLTVGNIHGSQGVLRYVPIPSIGDFPKVTLFGIGARHSVSQYIPLSPVDIAAGLFYQSFTVGDILDAKAFALNAQVSKTFMIITLYGGLQYETASVDLTYEYAGPQIPGESVDTIIEVNMKGENRIRLRAGAGISLGFFHLNADINIGKITVLSAGIGFGI